MIKEIIMKQTNETFEELSIPKEEFEFKNDEEQTQYEKIIDRMSEIHI
jgi:hypothetical protein